MNFKDTREANHVVAAILILTIVAGFAFILKSNWLALAYAFIFATIIILVNVFAKKLTAYLLDSDVEHQLWTVSRFGLREHWALEKEIPAGIIFPLFFTLFSLGRFIFSPILTYEARAMKVRAAKRFGFYSYSELTDFHNALIGAGGIIALLILSFISYFPGFERLSILSLYYAFWNIIPISKLDGTQIFFGSRTLWTALALIIVLTIALLVITGIIQIPFYLM